MRLAFPGAVYHLTARGNAQQDIFRDAMDHEAFLAILGRERFDVIVKSLLAEPFVESKRGDLDELKQPKIGVAGIDQNVSFHPLRDDC